MCVFVCKLIKELTCETYNPCCHDKTAVVKFILNDTNLNIILSLVQCAYVS